MTRSASLPLSPFAPAAELTKARMVCHARKVANEEGRTGWPANCLAVRQPIARPRFQRLQHRAGLLHTGSRRQGD